MLREDWCRCVRRCWTVAATASSGGAVAAALLLLTAAAPALTLPAGFQDSVFASGLTPVALHPAFPAQPYVYLGYTLDAAIGDTPPRWGTAGATSDGCPNPPGATGNGCVVGGRASRRQAAGDTRVGAEQVLIEGQPRLGGSVVANISHRFRTSPMAQPRRSR